MLWSSCFFQQKVAKEIVPVCWIIFKVIALINLGTDLTHYTVHVHVAVVFNMLGKSKNTSDQYIEYRTITQIEEKYFTKFIQNFSTS